MGAASVTLAPVAPTAPLRSAPPALTSSSARATTSAATAPAVASVTTPPASASASRATSAAVASRRPSSLKPESFRGSGWDPGSGDHARAAWPSFAHLLFRASLILTRNIHASYENNKYQHQ